MDMCGQTNMEHLSVELSDLPDEILIHIFQQLQNDEVLYSLLGVNQRLNRIVHDRIFTSDLCLLECSPVDDDIIPLSDPIVNRFCSTILPEIGHQIETLYVERIWMERILRATNYSNLNDLNLFDIDVKLAAALFLRKIFS